MPEGRPAIPAQLAREVKIEAGYRCAMPGCREQEIDLCHIVPWAEVQRHEFANLIALCTPHHRQLDRGAIDRVAIRQIKANLSVLNHRYGDVERRVFEVFQDAPAGAEIDLPGGMEILLMHAIDDGLLHKRYGPWRIGPADGPNMAPEIYSLTSRGFEFLQRYKSGQPVEQPPP